MKHIFLLICLLPVCCFAQLRISGKVIDAATKQPLSNASVFLNNATISTMAAVDGKFDLYNVRPGQYELIVTIIGYQSYHKTLNLYADTVLSNINLAVKTTVLREVRIGKDADRSNKLKEFKRQFIGVSQLAAQCEILNPDALNLKYSKGKMILTASSDEFLEISNKALGYKLKYLLNDFVIDKTNDKVTYEGSVLFEEMEGKPADKLRWDKYRRFTYFGSPTHFFRELLAGRADSSFLVQWIRSAPIKKDGKEELYTATDSLKLSDYIHPTDQRGLFAMGYPHDVSILYKDRYHLPTYVKPNFHLVSEIKFIQPYLFFDANGIVTNPTGTYFKHAWGYSRVAEILPVDYRPGE